MSEQSCFPPAESFNAELLRQVHPEDWQNPQAQGRYNLVVLGGGSAGLVTAAGAAGLGAKVALVEQHLLGGDCLNSGCVPSKALIKASRAFHATRQAKTFGVMGTEQLQLDFSLVMERVRKLRAEISVHDSAQRFRDLGVDVFFGQGRFTSTSQIEIDGQQLNFSRAAICTGARPTIPDIPGLAQSGYLTSESIFNLTSLPKRLAILGGGPIGCELAQAFARLGSRVCLIHRGQRLLPREEPEAGSLLTQIFTQEQIEVHVQTKLLEITRHGSELALLLSRDTKTWITRADALLVAVGRTPNIKHLHLEQANIQYQGTGIQVDNRLQTSNPRVFAAGDVCSLHKFTHAADAQARLLLANALFFARQKQSSLIIPRCTYTSPEIAHVGPDSAQLPHHDCLTIPFAQLDRAVLDHEHQGFAKVYLRKGTDHLLAATLVGSQAGELINEFSVALTNNLRLRDIGKTIHPYPTHAEIFRKAADHFNRQRLSPALRALCTAWFQWRRS